MLVLLAVTTALHTSYKRVQAINTNIPAINTFLCPSRYFHNFTLKAVVLIPCFEKALSKAFSLFCLS